jgi:putative transposase
MTRDSRTPPVVALTEAQRQVAMERFAVLQPHLEEDVPLARAARQAGVPVRTAERWLARYRQRGLAGLARPVRKDAAVRRLPAELVALIEGMGLKKLRASAATIHRRVRDVATAQGWPLPSYGRGHRFKPCIAHSESQRVRDDSCGYCQWTILL